MYCSPPCLCYVYYVVLVVNEHVRSTCARFFFIYTRGDSKYPFCKCTYCVFVPGARFYFNFNVQDSLRLIKFQIQIQKNFAGRILRHALRHDCPAGARWRSLIDTLPNVLFVYWVFCLLDFLPTMN